MTTDQLEHLKLIDAHLERLLAIAEKRTPGEWVRPSPQATHLTCAQSQNYGSLVCDFPDSSPNCDQHGPDATFIASCAGNAEAGWRATRAAIAWLDRRGAMFGLVESEQLLLESIFAAFPLESLK